MPNVAGRRADTLLVAPSTGPVAQFFLFLALFVTKIYN